MKILDTSCPFLAKSPYNMCTHRTNCSLGKKGLCAIKFLFFLIFRPCDQVRKMRLAIKYSTYYMQYHVKTGCHSKVFYKKQYDNMQDEKNCSHMLVLVHSLAMMCFQLLRFSKVCDENFELKKQHQKIRTCLHVYQSNFLFIKYVF